MKTTHESFGHRMHQATDTNSNVPPLNFGRLGWIAKQLEDRYSISVTQETVRKWFAGDTFPRQKTLEALSEVLGVDSAWLALGRAAEVPVKLARQRNAIADGAVNLVAGFVQMNGGTPAFPDAEDPRAKKDKIDLYAIIRGAQYAFHIALGVKQADGSWKVFVPNEALMSTVIIAVIPIEPLHAIFLELDPETIEEKGQRSHGNREVSLAESDIGTTWRRIDSFAERV